MTTNTFVTREDGFWYAPSVDPKDENAYTLDFTDLLDGDTISSDPIWTSTSNITIDTLKNSYDTTTATVWLKDAILNSLNTVECVINTANGRVFARSFKIECAKL